MQLCMSSRSLHKSRNKDEARGGYNDALWLLKHVKLTFSFSGDYCHGLALKVIS